jgi:hypothetical protein
VLIGPLIAGAGQVFFAPSVAIAAAELAGIAKLHHAIADEDILGAEP